MVVVVMLLIALMCTVSRMLDFNRLTNHAQPSFRNVAAQNRQKPRQKSISLHHGQHQHQRHAVQL
jgi:hypothetical protein